jgi:hypothetical protein
MRSKIEKLKAGDVAGIEREEMEKQERRASLYVFFFFSDPNAKTVDLPRIVLQAALDFDRGGRMGEGWEDDSRADEGRRRRQVMRRVASVVRGCS